MRGQLEYRAELKLRVTGGSACPTNSKSTLLRQLENCGAHGGNVYLDLAVCWMYGLG